MTDVDDEDTPLVRVARDVRQRRREPSEFDKTFAMSTVYVARTTGVAPA